MTVKFVNNKSPDKSFIEALESALRKSAVLLGGIEAVAINRDESVVFYPVGNCVDSAVFYNIMRSLSIKASVILSFDLFLNTEERDILGSPVSSSVLMTARPELIRQLFSDATEKLCTARLFSDVNTAVKPDFLCCITSDGKIYIAVEKRALIFKCVYLCLERIRGYIDFVLALTSASDHAGKDYACILKKHFAHINGGPFYYEYRK